MNGTPRAAPRHATRHNGPHGPTGRARFSITRTPRATAQRTPPDTGRAARFERPILAANLAKVRQRRRTRSRPRNAAQRAHNATNGRAPHTGRRRHGRKGRRRDTFHGPRRRGQRTRTTDAPTPRRFTDGRPTRAAPPLIAERDARTGRTHLRGRPAGGVSTREQLATTTHNQKRSNAVERCSESCARWSMLGRRIPPTKRAWLLHIVSLREQTKRARGR